MKSTQSDWLIPGGLMALSLVPVLAGVVRLTQIASGVITPENARFLTAPWPVLIHIPAVITYSLLGAMQFSPGFRRRHRGWHRAAGRILVVCGLLVALSGLWMAQFYAWPPGDGQLVYAERLVFGTAMLISIVLAVNAIRRRDFVVHGAWMTRAYAIGMGAGTQVFTHLPWLLLVGTKPVGLARAAMMGAGWIINVVAAEFIIRSHTTRKPIITSNRAAGRPDGVGGVSSKMASRHHSP